MITLIGLGKISAVRNYNECHEIGLQFNCKNNFAGGTGQPSTGSLRLAAGIMALCLLVFCSTYAGNLIAGLTGNNVKCGSLMISYME